LPDESGSGRLIVCQVMFFNTLGFKMDMDLVLKAGLDVARNRLMGIGKGQAEEKPVKDEEFSEPEMLLDMDVMVPSYEDEPDESGR